MQDTLEKRADSSCPLVLMTGVDYAAHNKQSGLWAALRADGWAVVNATDVSVDKVVERFAKPDNLILVNFPRTAEEVEALKAAIQPTPYKLIAVLAFADQSWDKEMDKAVSIATRHVPLSLQNTVPGLTSFIRRHLEQVMPPALKPKKVA